MEGSPIIGAAEFRRRILAVAGVVAVVTILLVSGYLALLLRLPREQWAGFAGIVAGFFALLLPLSTVASNRANTDVVVYLAAREQGCATRPQLEAGFACLGRLPILQFTSGILWWIAGGLLVGGAMWLRYESFSAFQALVTVLAAGSGGFVTSTFLFFVHKRHFAGLHEALAREIGAPDRREALVSPVPIHRKLLVVVGGVTFVMVSFAMCLAYVSASRQLERSLVDNQRAFLEGLRAPLALGEAGRRMADLGLAEALVLVDPVRGEVVSGPGEALLPVELRAIQERPEAGSSLVFDSPNVFAWRRLPGSELVVVSARSWRDVTAGAGAVFPVFGIMLALTAGIAATLGKLLSDDLGQTSRELHEEVERMAGGDLCPGRIIESEDELGRLARSFERMVGSLRGIVVQVAGGADAVDEKAGEISELAAGVARAARDQGEGVKQSTALIEGASAQIEHVSGAAHELNVLVEESSSSILEMGAAGEELNDTAGVLSSKVEEVSTSIEQMVRSVKEVASTTESLSDAASETSGSMEEMASAMRQVDITAEQTAKLSRGVVESAERGRAKVSQTIAGMESIRAATDSAERVIRGLGARTKEIGAILDVIDDVADETNLLALNAAIIAAQAGEHGRAFSVVADEIKELADRVLASTKEIGGLIRAVQDESGNAVGAIEEGARSVASGVDLSMEAGDVLEEITQASRQSGERIQEIVNAVREQTKAAAHVVELMERVNQGVGAIRHAAGEQDRGNEVVFRSSVAMREVSQQLRSTTEEQARGGARIRESIDGVRDAVEAINRAIQVQSESNAELARFLEEVSARSVASDTSASRMEEATRGLREQSDSLREEVGRFQL